ncbi:MAG: TlpA disulfide reductase family protein [Thermodesulfobacteriota bacterium]
MDRKTLGGPATIWRGLLLALVILALASSAWAAGKAAPDFTLKDVTGKDYTLSQFKGKVVVVNFFTIMCGPCRQEMPDLNQIYKENKQKGLQVLGICLQTDPPMLRFLAKQMALDYPFLVGTDKVDQAYGSVAVVPTTFIIDRQGNIVQKIEGTRKKEEFLKIIQPLL